MDHLGNQSRSVSMGNLELLKLVPDFLRIINPTRFANIL